MRAIKLFLISTAVAILLSPVFWAIVYAGPTDVGKRGGF
jgi:hypothetical protein